MFTVIGLLCLGMAVGYPFRNKRVFRRLDKSISYTVYIMLFIFGITIGANKELLEDIGSFGLQALVIAVMTITGSAIASYFAYKLFLKRGGRIEK